MRIIKKNIGHIRLPSGFKTPTSLFKCPNCKKTVERITAAGLRSHTCSKKCGIEYRIKQNSTHKGNICLDCAVDKCEWLLNGEPIRNWKAAKVNYPGTNKKQKTYKIKSCPNFKPQ